MRLLLNGFIFLFLCTMAFGQQQTGGVPAPDLFVLPTPMQATNNDINNNTLSSQKIDTTKKNLILIVAGQSNIANVGLTQYTPSNPTGLDELYVSDGAIYKAIDPALGVSIPTGGVAFPGLRIADTLVTNGKFDRVILVPISIGGTLIADWATGVESNRIQVALLRIKNRGITCGGTNQTCAIIWGIGESDEQAGTSQVSWTASFNTIVSNNSSFVGRWFVAEQTWWSGVSAAIQAAQTVASPSGVINNGAGIYAGPNADVLINSTCGGVACRQAANLPHFTDAGCASYAAAWVTALAASGAPF